MVQKTFFEFVIVIPFGEIFGKSFGEIYVLIFFLNIVSVCFYNFLFDKIASNEHRGCVFFWLHSTPFLPNDSIVASIIVSYIFTRVGSLHATFFNIHLTTSSLHSNIPFEFRFWAHVSALRNTDTSRPHHAAVAEIIRHQ